MTAGERAERRHKAYDDATRGLDTFDRSQLVFFVLGYIESSVPLETWEAAFAAARADIDARKTRAVKPS